MCKIEGCNGKGALNRGIRIFIRGYCERHYRISLKGNVFSKPERKKILCNINYRSYKAMIERCHYVLNKNYEHYNKRKISVCDRWKDKEDGFSNFCADMGERPSLKYSLDRIDNDLGYFKENCRWATIHQQASNRSDNNEFVGVRLTNRGNYRAQLTVSKVRYEKYFSSVEDAILYRKSLELKYL